MLDTLLATLGYADGGGSAAGHFVLLTLLIGGGAAWQTGQAVAQGWGAMWPVAAYTALLAAGNDPTAPIEHLRRATEIDPAFALAHNNLGVALQRAGHYAEALEHFRHAVGVDPGNAAAHLNLGEALLRAGNRDEAIAEFERTLEIDPANAGARAYLVQARRSQ